MRAGEMKRTIEEIDVKVLIIVRPKEKSNESVAANGLPSIALLITSV
jgi:hypothetical protein